MLCVCRDSAGAFGGDENLAKFYAHELRSLNTVVPEQESLGDLLVPPLAMIDVLGYRVIAVASLPESCGKAVYGHHFDGTFAQPVPVWPQL